MEFARRPLIAFLEQARQGNGPPDAATRLLAPPGRVALPSLPVGGQMLPHMALREAPDGASWRDTSYDSQQLWECSYRDALVHGPEGIVCLGEAVVAETLLHAPPGSHEPAGDAIRLPDSPAMPLDGTWLSLLVGGHLNYYHWMIEGLGRIALADPDMLAEVRQVLVPGPSTGFRADSLALSGVLAGRSVLRAVQPGEALRVARMVVPWATSHAPAPHPRLAPFFARLSQAASPAARSWPARIYIDRTGATHRPLANEAALIQALAASGFTPIRLEAHPLAEQIALFAHADIIVAPHGAGLTNLVFARPGALVLELVMDGYLNWCFRRLAAACGVRYDCVVGHQHDARAWVHARHWHVSVTHVMAAVEFHAGAAPG